jgi:hypothetical protein
MTNTVKNIYTKENNSSNIVSINSIPADGKHLIIKMSGSNGSPPQITWNNNTSSNYVPAYYNSQNNSVGYGAGNYLVNMPWWNFGPNEAYVCQIVIPFYSLSGTLKVAFGQSGQNYYWSFNGTYYYNPVCGMWCFDDGTSTSNAAITSLQIGNATGATPGISVDVIY